MALEDFETEDSNRYKTYGSHDYDEELEQMIEEFQDRFPIELKIEFIEVSPRMEKHQAMAYRRGSSYYIRVSESFINRSDYERISRTVLHEMVHVYLYQMGYEGSNHDKYFRWIVGRVGASMTHASINDAKWQDCIEPFIKEADL